MPVLLEIKRSPSICYPSATGLALWRIHGTAFCMDSGWKRDFSGLWAIFLLAIVLLLKSEFTNRLIDLTGTKDTSTRNEVPRDISM